MRNSSKRRGKSRDFYSKDKKGTKTDKIRKVKLKTDIEPTKDGQLNGRHLKALAFLFL